MSLGVGVPALLVCYFGNNGFLSVSAPQANRLAEQYAYCFLQYLIFEHYN